MTTRIFAIAFAIACVLGYAEGAHAFSADDVIEWTRSGMTQRAIIDRIVAAAGPEDHFSLEDLVRMRRAGVADGVLEALLHLQTQTHGSSTTSPSRIAEGLGSATAVQPGGSRDTTGEEKDLPKSPREAFRARLGELLPAPTALHDSIVMLKAELVGKSQSTDIADAIAREWLEYIERNAAAWCDDPGTKSSPYVAHMFSFEAARWPAAAVDAEGNPQWSLADGYYGRSRVTQSPATIRNYSLSPPLPVSDCNRHTPDGPPCGQLEPSLNLAWKRWNAEWDSFESMHRGAHWREVAPFFRLDGDAYVRDLHSPLDLKISANGKLSVFFGDVELMSASTTSSELDNQYCPFFDSYSRFVESDGGCGYWIKEVFFSPNSVAVILEGNQFFQERKVLAFKHPGAPQAVLFCSPGARPLVQPPGWSRKYVAGGDLGRISVIDESSAATWPNSARNPTPDLDAVDAVLVSEAKEPKASPKLSEGQLLDWILRRPHYARLRAALASLPREGLPRRLLLRDAWLEYLDSPRRYKVELEEQRAEEKREAKEYASRIKTEAAKNRARLASETRILSAIPIAKQSCKNAIDLWHRSNREVQTAAVAGHPGRVKVATASRERAGKQVCLAANSLRAAIGLYERDGHRDAASAVARDNYSCLQSCPSR